MNTTPNTLVCIEPTQDSIIRSVEETQSYDLSLDQVNWNPSYILSKASIPQIIISFKNILKVNPKNEYETTLYQRLKPAVEILINAYDEILRCKNLKENQVKYYNLIINMPSSVTIFHKEHGRIRMSNAKIGALIEACKQRIKFILERDIPSLYLTDHEILQEFNKMKSQMENFEYNLLDFEAEFILAIDEAHKTQQSFHQ